MNDERNRRERKVAGGSTPTAKGKAPGSARYDLGVPGLIARCIEDLYRSTGTHAAPIDRLFPIVVVAGVIMGLGFGYDHEGGLYGPIGAVLGAVFGLIGGSAVGAVIHWGLRPFLRPESQALMLTRTGRIRSASKAMRRARWWIFEGGSAASRVSGLILGALGVARNDLPPDIAVANIEACEGIFAEAVGDSYAAAEAYKKALAYWPRHGFVLMSLLDLIIREEMWEMGDEAIIITERFIDQARDKALERAAREYLALFKPAPEPAPILPTSVSEESPVYRRAPETPKPLSCKLIENPGSQISNGLVIIKEGADEKSFKLPPMPFQLMIALADMMMKSGPSREPAQMGWVSINDLLTSLPWTTPNVTNSNVHKLVYKTRNHLAAQGIDRGFIEENLNGCYRLCLPPEHIEVERVAAA